jgi:hypothetical protein
MAKMKDKAGTLMRSAAMTKKDNGRKSRPGKVLDLNTKILISIRDEVRGIAGTVREHTGILQEHTVILHEHTEILKEHTAILKDHTSILKDHTQRMTNVENAVIDLTRGLRSWGSHFDRDFLRLANEFHAIRSRVEKCEAKLSL